MAYYLIAVFSRNGETGMLAVEDDEGAGAIEVK